MHIQRSQIANAAAFPIITKFLLVLMLFYEGWYLQKFAAISGLLQILALTIVGTTIFLLIPNLASGKNKLIVYWGLFGVFCVFSSKIVAADFSVALNSLITYFAFIAMVYCADVVSRYTNDYTWFSTTIVLVCLLSAFCALFYGVPYRNGAYYVTTMSAHNNPNHLGAMMSIGTFMLLFPKNKPRPAGWCFRIALSSVFFIVALETGSRSALLRELVVIVFFIIVKFKNFKGNFIERISKRLLFLFPLLFILIIVLSMINGNNIAGSAINRLIEEFNSDSFSGRTDLYDLAWNMYKEHPIFGIGYNCFAITSGYDYFTHSTYMELLSCTGTIGFLLFLGPILIATCRSFRAFKKDNGRSTTLLLLMLVSSLFGIVYYNMVFLMVLYLEISQMPSKPKYHDK